MRRALAIPALIVAGLLSIWHPSGAGAAPTQDRYFTTSDGVKLHYLQAGQGARTIVLVPGWTMPAWIWERQIADLSQHFRVIALDPRSQGGSQIAASGNDVGRHGADIGELLAQLGPEKVLLVGWSFGVLDSLAYLHTAGDSHLAGLVLVDNSIGEDPPPAAPKPGPPGPKLTWAQDMHRFVRTMFAKPQPQAWLDRLAAACLHTPEPVAKALLANQPPRTYWKEAVYSTRQPVLYLVRPKFAGQAGNLAAHHPSAETVVVQNLGHALFVDDPARFNAMLRAFVARRVWPKA